MGNAGMVFAYGMWRRILRICFGVAGEVSTGGSRYLNGDDANSLVAVLPSRRSRFP